MMIPLSVALVALLAPPPPTIPFAPAPRPTEAQDEDVERAIDALRRGAFAEARSIVDGLFIDDRERSAKELLASERPMQAIVTLDEALAVESLGRDRRSALLDLRGRAAFAAASSDVARAPLFEEARANFEEAARSGAGAASAFRASRAARMMGDAQGALDLARAAVRWVDGGEGRAEGLDVEQPFVRTWAEAAFGRYVEALQALPAEPVDDARTAELAELFAETKSALERSIGEAPTEPWGYLQLSNLHLWAGDRKASLTALEAALGVAPEDEAVHNALVRALGDAAQARAMTAEGATAADGLDARFEAILTRYERFRETHPENALGYWYGAYESFYRALTSFESGEHDAASFRSAETLLLGCRERAPDYRESCIDFEILCRVGAGWCEYQNKQNEEAITTFFSAEELRPLGSESNLAGRAAGLDLRLPGTDGGDRLPSALAGLDFVIRRYIADPNDLRALTRAAEIGDRMFAARPENANLANNAGFLNRDAAVLWETASRRALRGASSDEQRAAALRQRDRADAIMQRSWEAYQVAARLLPDDVRVVNDAGLVMAYYIRTDPGAAEAYFQDAIRDGAEQLPRMAEDDEARDALEEAWGDAHQNMGIIEMTLRSKPAAARAWFEKALEIGPPSRNWLRDVLPLLDEWASSGQKPPAIEAIEAQTIWPHNPR